MSYGNRTRRRAAGLLPEPKKCSARTQAGDPCKNSPVLGATVCRMHGGAASQVKRKAQERLAKGVLPLLGHLYKLATDEDVPSAVRLAAIRDWLDRAGVTAKLAIELEAGDTFRDIIVDIVSELPDDYEPAHGPGDYSQQINASPPEYELARGNDLDYGDRPDYIDAEVVSESEDVARVVPLTPTGPPGPASPRRDGPRVRPVRHAD